ncbi:hypothetical protein GPALN_003413 [Globodera pallida]|nr:hypothetical protein GPALN_003413 [Globodera pallida]
MEKAVGRCGYHRVYLLCLWVDDRPKMLRLEAIRSVAERTLIDSMGSSAGGGNGIAGASRVHTHQTNHKIVQCVCGGMGEVKRRRRRSSSASSSASVAEGWGALEAEESQR